MFMIQTFLWCEEEINILKEAVMNWARDTDTECTLNNPLQAIKTDPSPSCVVSQIEKSPEVQSVKPSGICSNINALKQNSFLKQHHVENLSVFPKTSLSGFFFNLFFFKISSLWRKTGLTLCDGGNKLLLLLLLSSFPKTETGFLSTCHWSQSN